MQALLDCQRRQTRRARFLAIVAKTSQMTTGGAHCENQTPACWHEHEKIGRSTRDVLTRAAVALRS